MVLQKREEKAPVLKAVKCSNSFSCQQKFQQAADEGGSPVSAVNGHSRSCRPGLGASVYAMMLCDVRDQRPRVRRAHNTLQARSHGFPRCGKRTMQTQNNVSLMRSYQSMSSALIEESMKAVPLKGRTGCFSTDRGL